jgi:lysophospholipase L1-like esterase
VGLGTRAPARAAEAAGSDGGGNAGRATAGGAGASAGRGAEVGGSAGRSEAGSAGVAPSGAGGLGGGTAGAAGRGAGGAAARGGGAGRAGAASGGAAGLSGGAGNGAAGGGTLTGPVTVFIAGDSTVQSYTDTASTMDQAGWGQMIGALFQSNVEIDNRAIGGRTARRFIDEGHLDEILADIHAGDYLLVQFGTNDSNKTATYDLNGQTIPYYLDPETDFKTYLRMYLTGTTAHSARLVLVTPPPRNSAYCTGGNGTGAWAQAMRELGTSDGIPVLDLNQRAVDYLMAICPAPTPEDFFLLKSDGTVDGTHFQENGARILAGFVADEMRRVGLPLASALK